LSRRLLAAPSDGLLAIDLLAKTPDPGDNVLPIIVKTFDVGRARETRAFLVPPADNARPH